MNEDIVPHLGLGYVGHADVLDDAAEGDAGHGHADRIGLNLKDLAGNAKAHGSIAHRTLRGAEKYDDGRGRVMRHDVGCLRRSTSTRAAILPAGRCLGGSRVHVP